MKKLLLVACLGLVLAAPIVRADAQEKCMSSHGLCVGCCLQWIIEEAFDAMGGW